MLAKFTTKEEIAKLISEFFDKMHQQRVDAQKAQEKEKEAARLQQEREMQQKLKELEAARNLELAQTHAAAAASVVVSPSPVFAVESNLKASVDPSAVSIIASSPTKDAALVGDAGEGSSVMLRDVGGTKTVVEKLPLEGTFCSEDTRLEGWLSKVRKAFFFTDMCIWVYFRGGNYFRY